MKTQNLLFFFIAIVGISCKNSTVDTLNIDANTDILLVDSSGKNLLESNHINRDAIAVYYLVNGQKQLYSHANLDYPKGYRILKDEKNRDVLRLFLNYDENTPTTLLAFSDTDVDTVKCEFYRKGASIVCTKIWYNGEQKWGLDTTMYSKLRTFSITK